MTGKHSPAVHSLFFGKERAPSESVLGVRAVPLFTEYPRRLVFPITRIHPPVYLTVPGRRQTSLISELPRRVLLGNRACGIRISRKLEPLRGHQSNVCRANKNSPPALPFGGCRPIRSRDTIEGKPNERTIRMLLENKNAIIYGAGGSIGGAVAREFAREGARVFLAGRTREKLDTVASDIASAGGSAEVAVLDALDERAVDEHTGAVVSEAGSIDISFNLVTRGDVQGIPLIEMTADDLLRAVVNGLRTNFLTARAAARQMVEQGSGVILALDSGSGKGSPMMGGTGPEDAATDTFIRNLATEVGAQGVRVVGIW